MHNHSTGPSCRADNDFPRLFPSPNPRAAPCGPDSHPMAPHTIARCREDYDSDSIPDANPNYLVVEEERCLHVCAKGSKNAMPPVLQPRDEVIDIWCYLKVGDIAQALNLCHGPPHGNANTGPSHVTTATDAVQTSAGCFFGSTLLMVPPVVLPPVQPGGKDEPGYLGTAPVDPSDVAPLSTGTGDFRIWQGLPNSLATTMEVLYYWSFADTKDWASGLRNMHCEHLQRSGDKPHVCNVLAFHTFMVLGPANRRLLQHQWHMFFETGIVLFSIPALLVLDRQHHHPPHYSVVVQHGIAPASEDVAHLEAFTCSQCNMHNNVEDLGKAEWNEEPHNTASTMAADPSAIPTWSNLRHAPHRPNPAPAGS
ncbi:hypothetical protein B0H17DRAFT_1147335 [Mycena rosella]|uniref:Uncharacterized protein n=1 Tax=Mycena rosella TaxID=1033263 RepID=A0AAD7G2H1_MYCRO|nr:hypothetical protein B0H17DRAFT_1147335 [Mycena rosella]